MIHVTRLNHTPVVLNCDLIEQIETTPDTVISLTTGQKIMVLESIEDVIELIRQFRHSILLPSCDGNTLPSSDRPHGKYPNSEKE